jgi:hypothetical protein
MLEGRVDVEFHDPVRHDGPDCGDATGSEKAAWVRNPAQVVPISSGRTSELDRRE